MTSKEFDMAWRMAIDPSVILDGVSDEALHGCALPDFVPVAVTIPEVAKHLRWQCLHIFGGGYDQQMLDECRTILVKWRRCRIIHTADSDKRMLDCLTKRLLS